MDDQGYDGVDLDFEGVQWGERADLNLVVDALSTQLHARKKLLSMTCGPLFKDNPSQPLDLAHYAVVADEVKLMTYTAHGSWSGPGAIGPLDFDESAVKFALSMGVPKEKLRLGVPFFGKDWPSNGGAVTSVTWTTAQPLIAKSTTGVLFDSKSGESHFDYKDGSGVLHTVWFQDAKAIQAKVDLSHARHQAPVRAVPR